MMPLEQRLHYTFKNKDFLKEALTHKSFCIHDRKNQAYNERFEFLGDGLLGFVMAELLMKLFPQDNEGLLSKKRASLVNQEILAQKALELKLDECLTLGPGEREQGSHLKPRILASTFEAVLGAMYLDSDFATLKVWIEKSFSKDISLIKPDLEYERDYKTRLQELTQKLKMGTPEYKLLLTQGPSHQPDFLVAVYLNQIEQARAQGKSKKTAEQLAAQMLLEKIEKEKNEAK